MLPVVNLQLRQDWAPVTRVVPADQKGGNVDGVASGQRTYHRLVFSPAGYLLRMVGWIEVIFGWVASGVLVAVLSNLARRE